MTLKFDFLFISMMVPLHLTICVDYVIRYYELGPDDPPYAAKFWDCCGSEDPGAKGCKTSFHVSYDDDA